VYVERTGFSYEGDWLPWRVEYSEESIPYLHLEGLLMCAYWRAMDCSTGKTNIEPVEAGDTKDPFTGEYYWYDRCREEWVQTPGEGVFLVQQFPFWDCMLPVCTRHQPENDRSVRIGGPRVQKTVHKSAFLIPRTLPTKPQVILATRTSNSVAKAGTGISPWPGVFC